MSQHDAHAAFGMPGGGSGRPRRTWPAVLVVGVLGLVAGGALGVVGARELDAKTVTETAAAAGAGTVTVRTPGETRTITKVRQRVRTVGAGPDRAREVDVFEFRGDGGLTLPPIVVEEPSTLRWTNDGGLFQVWDKDYAVSVNSQGRRGQSHVEPGRYRLEINAVGSWAFDITPN